MSNVLGGGGNDSLTGTADRDYMLGGAGNDTIDSGAGYDWVEGGTGADTFVFKPGCGWDCIGDFKVAEGDRIDLSAWSGLRSFADLTISSEGGDAVLLFGPNDGVRLIGVPAASLTADRFVFAGGSTGGGTGGGDMTGQTITGTANRDYLIGGALNDEISSGAGNDYIEGGAGSDLFKFAAGDGWDYIQDFQAGATGDVIDLSGWSSIRSMADISITSDSSGTSLVFGPNDGVRLNGVSAGSLTYANFHFAGGGTGGTNHAPVAQGQSLTTDEDEAVSGTLTATDPDPAPQGLTYALAQNGGPQHGAVTINPDGTFTYTPTADYFGTDRFTFEVTDSGGLKSTASVDLTVNQLADDPYVLFRGVGPDGTNQMMMRKLSGGVAQPAQLPNHSEIGNKYITNFTGDALYLTDSIYSQDKKLTRIDLTDPDKPATVIASGGVSWSREYEGKVYFSRANDPNLYSVNLLDPNLTEVNLGDMAMKSPPFNIQSASSYSDSVIVGGRLFAAAYGLPLRPDYNKETVGNEPAYFDINDLSGPYHVIADLMPGAGPVINYGPHGSYTYTSAASSIPRNFTNEGNDIYFSATTGSNEDHLYHMDATQPDATLSRIDGGNGPALSNIRNLTLAGDDLYFTAEASTTGVELYRLDLDVQGGAPTLVADLAQRASSSYPSNLTVVGDQLYFAAETGDGQRGLYHISLNDPGINYPVMQGNIGSGSPDPRTEYLYYSSDRTRSFAIMDL